MSKLSFRIFFVCILSVSIGKPCLSNAESKAQSIINASLKMLPVNQRQGVQDYLDVVGFQTSAGANVGIINFNDSYRAQNPCFNELSSRFYLDMRESDLNHILSKARLLENSSSWVMNPLSDDANTEALKPGWLWEKAMSFSKGNPVLAMQLIGVCGHDNTAQTDTGLSNKSEYLQNEIKNKSSSLSEKSTEVIKLAVSFAQKKAPDIDIQEYTKYITQQYASNEISCPSSVMFVPKSLGSEVDISDSLKNRIATIQAPTLGASALPAKYYHIIGAAYTSCFMYRRGVPSLVADALANKAIQTYRSGRLCEKLRPEYKDLSKMTKGELQKSILDVSKNSSICLKQSDGELSLNWDGPAICRLVDLIGRNLFVPQSDGTKVDSSIILNKLETILPTIDANYVFQNSNYWEQSNQCQGEQIGSAVRSFTQNFSFSEISKNRRRYNQACKDLVPERCANALKKVETYQVDFEWSEAQHKAGRDFAKQHCKPEHMKKPIEQVACEAIGQASSSSEEAASSPQRGAQ